MTETRAHRPFRETLPRVIVETRRADPSDLDAASEVLAAAFADYAWTRWTVDGSDHLRRLRALQRLALEHYGLAHGHVWVSLLAGEIQCVATWMDTGNAVPPELDTRLRPLVVRLEGDRHQASIAASAQLHGWRPEERHLYLGAVGTRPRSQRLGLGRLTLAPALQLADAEGVPAFLETSSDRNVAFYAGLGFEAVGHQVIDGGGPEVWAMLRTPR